METKIFTTVVFSLLISIGISGQKTDEYVKHKFLDDFHFIRGNDSIQPFYISSKPVTNREYIVYLLWLKNTYPDYPETFYAAIPELNSAEYYNKLNNSIDGSAYSMDTIVTCVHQKIRDYMFNAKYIDYPVMFLSYTQAANFGKWLSDRYNEFMLINNNILIYDPNQTNANCFVTESYLDEQYEGTLGTNNKRITWADHLFAPSLRLPGYYELETAHLNGDILIDLKPYEMYPFLCIGYSTEKQGKTIEIKYYENQVIHIEEKQSEISAKEGELFLEFPLQAKFENILDSYKDLGQQVCNDWYATITNKDGLKYLVMANNHEQYIQKNNLGQMPYMIIGESTNKTPLLISPTKHYYNEGQMKPFIFRVAFSALKE
jgi:hypothetical protein